AGLLAKNAIEKGLEVPAHVKTSLAPGSKVVTRYLEDSNLMTYLDQLGFNLVGYGCTTCIGNSGPLKEEIEEAIIKDDLLVSSVLSGNRNFEGRIHPLTKANYLASPPLVVAYALAGTVDINLATEPLGIGKDGEPVYMNDIWPSLNEDIEEAIIKDDLLVSSVLSGNRNFEGRIHPLTKANYLASPPLVVAYALAGTVDINLATEPLGIGKYGEPVYMNDIWPSLN